MITWIYDVETLKNCFTAVFIDVNTNPKFIEAYEWADINKKDDLKRDILNNYIKPQVFIISKDRNDLDLLIDFMSVHKTLVGYNSINFDDNVMNYILMNYKKYNKRGIHKEIGKHITHDIHKLAQELIDYGNGWKFLNNDTKYFKAPYYTKDLQKLLYLDKKFVSLKQVGVQLRHYRLQDLPVGHNDIIPESLVPSVVDYNINDVLITYKLYHNQIEEIDLREAVTNKYGINVRTESRSGMANKLMSQFYSEESGIPIHELINLRTERRSIKYDDIISDKISFTTPELKKFLSELRTKKIVVGYDTLSEMVLFDDNGYTFATGGIHSIDRPNIYRKSDKYIIRDADVASFYPRIILNERAHPEHLDADIFLSILSMITDSRLAAKNYTKKLKVSKDASDTIKHYYNLYKNETEALKIVINAIYGKLGDENSFLYDLKAMYKVTINGQLYLLMLIEMLAKHGIKCISANTDGVICKIPVDKEDIYYATCKEWEVLTNFDLEYTDYEKYVCYAVNDYMAIKDGYSQTQKTDKDKLDYIKEKGMFVTSIQIDKGYRHPIIPKALVQHFADGIDYREYIRNHKDIYDFCISIKTGSDFVKEYQFVEDDKLVIDELQKNIRYYIGNSPGIIMKRYEIPKIDKKGKRREYISLHKGVNSIMFNDFVSHEEMKQYRIDYSYYYNQATEAVIAINNQNTLKMKKQAYGGLFNEFE